MNTGILTGITVSPRSPAAVFRYFAEMAAAQHGARRRPLRETISGPKAAMLHCSLDVANVPEAEVRNRRALLVTTGIM
jgi:hypothetical protein